MFDFMEPNDQLGQARSIIGGICDDAMQSYNKDSMLCSMESNSRLIADAQLHTANQLLHQDFNRRYGR